MLLVAIVIANGVENNEAIAGIVASVVFLSIAIQGITAAPLIEKLGIVKISKTEEHYSEMKARYRILKAGKESLKNKFNRGLIDEVIYKQIAPGLRLSLQNVGQEIESAVGQEKRLKEKDILQTRIEIYEDMVAEIRNEYLSGTLSDKAYKDLREEYDKKLLNASVEIKKLN